MNQSKGYEKRMLIAFLLSFVLLGVMFWVNSRKKKMQPPTSTNAVVVATNKAESADSTTTPTTPTTVSPAAQKIYSEVKSKINFASRGKIETFDIAYSNLMRLSINTYGATIDKILVNGSWNQYTNDVSLGSVNSLAKNGDLYFGDMNAMLNITNRPIYKIAEKTDSSAVLVARLKIKDTPIRISREYSVTSNYILNETISIKNLSKIPVNININDKSFTVGHSFQFFTKETANPRNKFECKYYDGKDLKTAVQRGGIIKKKIDEESSGQSEWFTMSDYYFIGLINPEGKTFSGKYKVLHDEKSYIEVIMAAENAPFVLEKNEEKQFKLSYYIGPKKESILKKLDKSYKKIFSWPPVFNWLMKPIEMGLTWLMFALGSFIPNWGIVIIILAMIIKLALSPLSVKAAISIKRMNILQPKMKQIQEKYKDNKQVMQQKIGELYKKEGVNPIGGCWPMLLQIPVFFALFRVLSSSVELRGAKFLWIKDLTLPDTLFKMNVPLLPKEFNLLPILMTIIQLVQTHLQSSKNPTMQQNKLQTYLLPVMFLFLFWNMPSGLVLYWTVQNIYTIIEQYIINKDKYIKLK